MKLRTFLLVSAVFVIGLPLYVVFTASSAKAFLISDGDSAPMIFSASLQDPQRHNELLEADLSVTGWSVGDIERYEYRWNRSTIGAVHSTDVDDPVVSFVPTIPNARHILQIRAVDDAGMRSRWYEAADMVTPPPPRVIVAGDSIASGYTRQWFTSDGSCRDNAYAYGATAANEIASGLPRAWAPTYHNIAWAGAGVHSMWNGGTDSCDVEHVSQVDEIKAVADPSTWNIVVITAGINSTNWSNVVTDLTRRTAFSFSELGDKKACQTAVLESWNLPSRTDSIASATKLITETLATQTNADLYWTSYFTISGSRLAPGWTPIGAECDDEMEMAMSLLDTTLQSGLADPVTWIDIDRGTVPLQDWGGWPHPNQDGHTMIGRTVAAAIGQSQL